VYDAKIKRIGNAILETYSGQLSTDFRSNKAFLSGILSTKSKFMVNKISGYVTSQVKRQIAQSQLEEQPETGSEPTEEAT